MQSFVLQDWITVRGSGLTPVIQEAKGWLAFSSFQDIVFHLDIRRLQTNPLAGFTWNFQTAPTKDEALFQTMVAVAGGAPSVVAVPVLLATNPLVPLATWVRWTLTPLQPTTWDTTFRVMASANRLARGLA